MNLSYEQQISKKQDLTFSVLEKEMSKKIGVVNISPDILRTLGLVEKDSYNHAAALIADENEYPGIDITATGKRSMN